MNLWQFLVICSVSVLATAVSARRVAIIGGGSGGSSTAYHLAKFQGMEFNVTIFEKESRIGGRTTTINVHNDPNYPMELGASVFVDANRILMNAVSEYGLEFDDSDYVKEEGRTSSNMGIWDGEKMVLSITSGNFFLDWLTSFTIVLKYGVSALRLRSLVGSFLNSFITNYYNESSVFPYTNLAVPGSTSGFNSVYSIDGWKYLVEKQALSDKLCGQLIESLTRVNYASNLNEIHGVEAVVSVAASSTYSVKGGNWKIFDHMARSSANVLLNTSVISLSKHNSQWKVEYKTLGTTSTNSVSELFDEVVIAAPLYQTGLIDGKQFQTEWQKNVSAKIPNVQYNSLYAILFTSPCKLSHDYFKTSENIQLDTVLTTSQGGHKIPFLSISTWDYIKDRKEHVYKIFSHKNLSSEYISTNFLEPFDQGAPITWIHSKLWNPYPVEKPVSEFPDFQVDDHLWYLNTMETFISTMETSALAGANVAELIVRGGYL